MPTRRATRRRSQNLSRSQNVPLQVLFPHAGLHRIELNFWRVSASRRNTIFPGFAGTPARLSGGVCVSGACFSRKSCGNSADKSAAAHPPSLPIFLFPVEKSLTGAPELLAVVLLGGFCTEKIIRPLGAGRFGQQLRNFLSGDIRQFFWLKLVKASAVNSAFP